MGFSNCFFYWLPPRETIHTIHEYSGNTYSLHLMDSSKEYVGFFFFFFFVSRWAPNSKRTSTLIASVNWMMKVYNKTESNRVPKKISFSLNIHPIKGAASYSFFILFYFFFFWWGGRPINNKRVGVTSSSRSQLVWPLSLSLVCVHSGY